MLNMHMPFGGENLLPATSNFKNTNSIYSNEEVEELLFV